MKRLISTLKKTTYNKLFTFQSKHFFWRKKDPVGDSEKMKNEETKSKKAEKELDENIVRQIENSQENFREFLNFMIKIDNFTWQQYYRMLLEKYKSNNSLSNKLRGVKEDKGTLDACNKIKCCLRESEQSKIKFTENERKIITNLTSISDENLKSIISNFIQIRLSHINIHVKLKAKQPLPKSFTELQKTIGDHNCPELDAIQDEYMDTTYKKSGMTKKEIQDKQTEIFRQNAKKIKRTRALY